MWPHKTTWANTVSHHLAELGEIRHCDSSDTMILACLMNLQTEWSKDHVTLWIGSPQCKSSPYNFFVKEILNNHWKSLRNGLKISYKVMSPMIKLTNLNFWGDIWGLVLTPAWVTITAVSLFFQQNLIFAGDRLSFTK